MASGGTTTAGGATTAGGRERQASADLDFEGQVETIANPVLDEGRIEPLQPAGHDLAQAPLDDLDDDLAPVDLFDPE